MTLRNILILFSACLFLAYSCNSEFEYVENNQISLSYPVETSTCLCCFEFSWHVHGKCDDLQLILAYDSSFENVIFERDVFGTLFYYQPALPKQIDLYWGIKCDSILEFAKFNVDEKFVDYDNNYIAKVRKYIWPDNQCDTTYQTNVKLVSDGENIRVIDEHLSYERLLTFAHPYRTSCPLLYDTYSTEGNRAFLNIYEENDSFYFENHYGGMGGGTILYYEFKE